MSKNPINPKFEKNRTEKKFKLFKPEDNAVESNSSQKNSTDASNGFDLNDRDDNNELNDDSSEGSKIRRKKKKSNSIFNLRNLFLVLGTLLFIYFSIRILVRPSLSQYPKLDSCFITSVFKINLCPSSSQYVRVNQVSKTLIHSILISEDDSFYMHQGIDWNEFQKSFVQNLKLGRFARGGSTITQQLVKNIYLSQDKSILRKLKEILIAQQMEEKYSKSIILEKYLNVIELGYQVYGVKSASWFYFNKSPSQLNILESLYLTMLLPNPKLYSSSFKHGKLTAFQTDRIKKLLGRLLRRKRISYELYSSAKSKINLFPWKNIDLDESQTIEDNDLDFINDKRIYLDNAIKVDPKKSDSTATFTETKRSDISDENESFDLKNNLNSNIETKIKTNIMPSNEDSNQPNSDSDSKFLDVEKIKDDLQDTTSESNETTREPLDSAPTESEGDPDETL